MMKTASYNTLNIKVNRVEFMGQKVMSEFGVQFSINPYLPYMYMPDEYYTDLVTQIEKLANVTCNFDSNYCLYSKRCEKFPINTNSFMMFYLTGTNSNVSPNTF